MSEESLGKATIATQELKEAVENLAHRADLNRDNINRGKRHTKWLFVSVILDILLSLILAGGGYWLTHIQDTQNVNTQLNRTNQCALVDLFLQFEKNSVNSPILTPEEKQQRVDSYRQIHMIHDNLNCSS